MGTLPLRGPTVRDLGLALPPAPMPRWRAGRPLKRWRYVGVYTPELMLCVGDARVGPVPQRFWAVALPDGELRERTTFGAGGVALDGSAVRVDAPGVRIDLALEESEGVETASAVDQRGAYIWTRKQACVPVAGFVEVEGVRHAIDAEAGFVDDSAGYHARHTTWKWSAGIGEAVDGRPLGWNLVTGLHDAVAASERTLWVAGETIEAGPARFADDLSSIEIEGGGELRFEEWSRREHSTNAVLMRSRYSQPFGSFGGTLPGGIQLAEGYGVMEAHDVRW